ncbi:organic hydroperoxide resistance protein [Paracoccus fistulariae]|uniref:Organic hydroperoxide resistance protein n=1 Tax=Paracoccus fistulariae TaxID=658446 RepID=A0ABY7SPB4_9RHOB|nr:organic hydroperoxide resistance protein [Paracoccus fistulariae]MDB6182282.1 organic hydroperoxide resistance protein [Paracoccus fistulariae]WCR08733.1 organic hydroperoxide resistance protein [Paracoccus fistulariae]
MKIFYKTRATATGGRSGRTELDDGSLGFDLAQPGTDKSGTNPEQLFALGYAACFDSALSLVAQQMKLDTTSKTSVEVGIGQRAEGGYALDIDIHVETSGISRDEAQKLIEATHQVCPYSNATRGNVDVRLHVTAA